MGHIRRLIGYSLRHKGLLFGFLTAAGIGTIFNLLTPLVMIENDCLIVTGNSLLQAFDRLEVAEFSARALIAARDVGPLVPIEEDELKALEEMFQGN